MNAERNSTSDMVLDNRSCHASVEPTLPTADHASSHRPAQAASAPGGQDPWASMLATIHQCSSPPDPLRDPPELSGRPRSGGGLPGPRTADGGEERTYTVTVVEELPNSHFSLCWHDPTLCHYQEQVWMPCAARASGHCALSGKRIGRGDPVYRPRLRGPARPLNGDAMILASELVKARTGV